MLKWNANHSIVESNGDIHFACRVHIEEVHVDVYICQGFNAKAFLRIKDDIFWFRYECSETKKNSIDLFWASFLYKFQ